jgi:hypothetical protein
MSKSESRLQSGKKSETRFADGDANFLSNTDCSRSFDHERHETHENERTKIGTLIDANLQRSANTSSRFLPSCIPQLRTLGGRPLLHACLTSDAKLSGRDVSEQDDYSRQQVGLQGASPGGQAEVMGSDRLPLEWGAACSLTSFSMAMVPHCGQAA